MSTILFLCRQTFARFFLDISCGQIFQFSNLIIVPLATSNGIVRVSLYEKKTLFLAGA